MAVLDEIHGQIRERLPDEYDFKYKNLTPSELVRVLATYLRIFGVMYDDYLRQADETLEDGRVLDQAIRHVTNPVITDRLYLIGGLLEGVGFEVSK